jgi:putative DNA primase/helicase
MARATETAQSIYQEILDCADSSGKKDLAKWALASGNEGKLRSMLNLAKEKLSCPMAAFDNINTVIHCRNGLVDLATGHLLDSGKDFLNLKRADVIFENGDKCPTWDAFVCDIFPDDSLRLYVQKALGYALTGEVDEQVFFIAYGYGANGKSTLFEVVKEILGDYAGTFDFSLLLASDRTSVRAQEQIGKLRGVRIAVASETDSTRKFDEAIVKRLTGGDTLTGARMYGDTYDFQPTHKLFLLCNHLPSIKDATDAIWRRIRIIPFERQFTGNEVIHDMKARLLGERSGIFAWLVEGAKMYYHSGLGDPPKVVIDAVTRYREDNDILSRFISDCLLFDKETRTPASEVYDAYLRWCIENKEQYISNNFFARGMEERKLKKHRFNDGMSYLGVRLKQDYVRFDYPGMRPISK